MQVKLYCEAFWVDGQGEGTVWRSGYVGIRLQFPGESSEAKPWVCLLCEKDPGLLNRDVEIFKERKQFKNLFNFELDVWR